MSHPVALLAAALAAAASPFEEVGPKGGPEAVTALAQDAAGFVWIGSREGLFRYDGYTLRAFRHDPDDARSLPDNAIRTVYEDREGSLWVGTNTGGLARLDRRSWTFERFRHDSAEPRSLSHDSVYAIVEDDDGSLWVGTQRGLDRLDRRTGRFEPLLAGQNGLEDDYVAALALGADGALYVGTVRSGLHRLDRGTGRFQVFRNDPRNRTSIPDDAVYALARDASGTLWVGTGRGLARQTPQGAFERVAPAPLFTAAPVINALAVAPDAVWAGTAGQGLWRVDPATFAVRVLRQSEREGAPPRRLQQHRRGGPADPAGDQIAAVLADRAGAVWTGTWGAGLFRVSRAALLLASTPAIVPPAEAAEESATAVMAARGGGAFVGTASGALIRVDEDRATRLLRRFPGDVLSIAEASDGTLWVGTTEALWHVVAASGAATAFRHKSTDPSSIGPGWVAAVREHAGALWIGTGEGGLQRLDASGRVVQRFRHDSGDAGSLSDDYVTAIVPDRRGTLWIGTRSGGLNAFDPGTGRAVRYRPQIGGADTLPHDSVTSLLEDSRGRLWVGTAGGGFARVETGPGGATRFSRVTTADGLVDDDVMALVEDARGTIFVGTRRGISRFDPERRSFVSWFPADGLASAQFERGAGARACGLVLLGSMRWMAALPDDRPFVPPAPSATVMTSIRTPAGERPFGGDASLEIRHGDWLAVELAVLDFASEGAHAYAYRLAGEAPWVELGDRREITFAGLAAGTFQLEARGRDAQGVWSSAPAIALRVVPPFWGRAWFEALVAAAIAAAAVGVHRWRESALERRNRELLAIDRERERSRSALAAAYDRLGLLTRRLEAAKEEERGHIARELHDELGPSLTAVIINLKLLGGLPDPESARRRLQDSTEIVDRMVQKIRDLSLDLRPPLLEELGLSAALRSYFDAQAERTGLAIELKDGQEMPQLSPEVAITAFRVTQEALTNAIRHASARNVEVTLGAGEAGLRIAVQDDGRGFDVGATLAGPASRVLGLLGMQERARLLGGQVKIASRPGAGTRVEVNLPFEVKP